MAKRPSAAKIEMAIRNMADEIVIKDGEIAPHKFKMVDGKLEMIWNAPIYKAQFQALIRAQAACR